MNLSFRYSTIADYKQIRNLLETCFGKMAINHGALNYLMGGYYLAFDNNLLISMTGIYNSNELYGYRINWTCTHPDYRGKGIMHKMIEHIISKNSSSDTIYVTAWKLSNKEYPNLHKVLLDNGFELVCKDFLNHINGCTRYCKDCIYSESCNRCTEWLYAHNVTN